MIRRHLTYANVTSTLALCVALGAGGAYAVDRIGSGDVKNNSLRSDDLRDRVAVKSKDVKKNALTGKEIQETRLAASGIAVATGKQSSGCEPAAAELNCLSNSVRLRQRSRIIAIATGDQTSDGAAGAAVCQVRVDGQVGGFSSHPGELSSNTSASAANGFARTLVSDPLNKGSHDVSLICKRNGSNPVRIDNPTLAIIAIGSR